MYICKLLIFFTLAVPQIYCALRPGVPTISDSEQNQKYTADPDPRIYQGSAMPDPNDYTGTTYQDLSRRRINIGPHLAMPYAGNLEFTMHEGPQFDRVPLSSKLYISQLPFPSLTKSDRYGIVALQQYIVSDAKHKAYARFWAYDAWIIVKDVFHALCTLDTEYAQLAICTNNENPILNVFEHTIFGFLDVENDDNAMVTANYAKIKAGYKDVPNEFKINTEDISTSDAEDEKKGKLLERNVLRSSYSSGTVLIYEKKGKLLERKALTSSNSSGTVLIYCFLHKYADNKITNAHLPFGMNLYTYNGAVEADVSGTGSGNVKGTYNEIYFCKSDYSILKFPFEILVEEKRLFKAGYKNDDDGKPTGEYSFKTYVRGQRVKISDLSKNFNIKLLIPKFSRLSLSEIMENKNKIN